MAGGVLLIGAALLLMYYNRATDARSNLRAEKALSAVQTVISERKTAPPAASAAPQNDPADMPEIELDGYGYIGWLSLPALELELPVMSRWDLTRLKTAPCRYYGSVNTGDFVIAGHNYTRHFGGLSLLEPGEAVIFTDVNGVSYIYEVALLETLEATAVRTMIDSDYDLTLYTCTYGGQNRVTVRCDLILEQ